MTAPIPPTWALTTIGEIAELGPKQQLDDDLEVGFLPMSGVPTGYLGRSEFESKKWGEVKKGYTHFKNDDVLIAKITPCFENGKATIVENFPNGFGAGSTEYHVLRAINSDVLPKLLLAIAKTRDFLINGATNMTGSVGHKRVPKEFVESYPFPLPPLAEQKQIAAKLDELLAQVDTLKARLDAIPAILKRFRQSVLAAAVSGRLTEGWREGNGKSEWLTRTLGDIAIVATGKTPSRSEDAYWKEGTVPWLTSAATGKAFCDTADQFVTTHAVQECSLKLFPPGTLLMAMYGEGKTRGQVTELKFPATCNQACAAISVDESMALNDYVKLRIVENYEETRKAASGGNQPNLNLNKVREISIPLPSLQEQTEIVRRVEQLFTFADQIEQRVRDAQARVNHLTQSILAKAFRGELTADWRAQNPELISGDNSAEALLARIRAARVEQPKAKRGRKLAKL